MILLRATRYYNNWVEVLSNRICIMSMFFMMMLSSSFTITMIAANDTDTSSSSSSSTGTNLDVFNYHETINNDYGPKDWGKVNCNDLNTCVRNENQSCICHFFYQNNVIADYFHTCFRVL